MREKLLPYLRLFSGLKAETFTLGKLSSLMGLLGVKLDLGSLELLLDLVQSQRGKSLGQLLDDEQLMNQLEALININSSSTDSADQKGNELINVHSAVRCPICEAAFAIIDAPGLREQLSNQKEVTYVSNTN